MALNIALLREEVHKLSGVTDSIFNIEQFSKLANSQEKTILEELKGKLEKLKGNTDSEIEKYIDSLKASNTPSDQIANITGSTAVNFEGQQVKFLQTQYPIINAVFQGIRNRMSQSSILSEGGLAAPNGGRGPLKRRAPARRKRTTTAAPKRKKKRSTRRTTR